jgi:hypothetical protein
MAADGAAAEDAEVPTPAVFAQGGGASRPGAGWVHVELHENSWKCNFCAKSFAGSNHTRVLGHLSGNDKGISWCRSVTPAVKGEMAQILQDATD